MEKIPALLSQARENLDRARVPRTHAETVAKQNRGVLTLIDTFIAPNAGQLQGELTGLGCQLSVVVDPVNHADPERLSSVDEVTGQQQLERLGVARIACSPLGDAVMARVRLSLASGGAPSVVSAALYFVTRACTSASVCCC